MLWHEILNWGVTESTIGEKNASKISIKINVKGLNQFFKSSAARSIGVVIKPIIFWGQYHTWVSFSNKLLHLNVWFWSLYPSQRSLRLPVSEGRLPLHSGQGNDLTVLDEEFCFYWFTSGFSSCFNWKWLLALHSGGVDASDTKKITRLSTDLSAMHHLYS